MSQLEKGGARVPSFEVQILRDKRWTTQEVHQDQSTAVAAAEKLAKGATSDGCRVVQDRLGPDGLHRERVIFEKIITDIPEKPVRIVPVEETNLCTSVEDVYCLESRMVIARMLKKYLDQQVLIPSELLYCYRPLSRLQDSDSMLLPAAVDRIVTLHGRDNPDFNAKEFRDEVYRWIDEVGRRARRAEGEKLLWSVTLSDFKKVIRSVAKAAFVHEEQEALLRHVIARECYKERNFLGKLEVLLECLSDDLSRDVLDIIDGFIADTLCISDVIQELLGSRPNLQNALVGLLDLMEGRPDSSGADNEPETAKVLRRLFAEKRLSAGITVLMDRVTREIGGKQPLSRNDPSQEHTAFLTLLDRLITREGVSGGASVAAALTRRYGLRVEQGGMKGWTTAVQGVSNLLKDNAKRLHYLIAVADVDSAEEHMTAVSEEVATVIKRAASITDFVEPRLSTTEKLRIITGIQKALSTSTLPEILRLRVAGRLDDLLAHFLIDQEVVERLDAPSDPLRMRALRLVKFCGSGILLEGKALSIARSRVLHHLRQPNFVENFTADIPEGDRDAAIRDFYKLLAEAGFSS